MRIENVQNLATALSKLSSAVDSAAASLNRSVPHDEALRSRIVSYKEIVRRQRQLLQELETASSRGAWAEVSRLTQLVHSASLLIKVDAGFILSVLKDEDLRNSAQ
jgi:hypothetical protein